MLRRTKLNKVILLDFEQTAQTCLSDEKLSEMTTARLFPQRRFQGYDHSIHGWQLHD